MSKTRVNLYILGGSVHSIAADGDIDVYEFHIRDDGDEEFADVLRYQSGMDTDRSRDSIDEARRAVDSGNLRRDRKLAPPGRPA